ncbi:hypothetical protein L3X38_037776 [Prunus dulcis]|uniref:Uncharacterized protein n=1 Tax=Prunus dulcis TaxID=3755 RepID=A0AAD4YRJ5_PRUDU|nr:hypothetical protein L3X38_037776 [Prunus dulcis]
MRKKPDESLIDYLKRFKAKKANIVGCDDRITSFAFKKGLPAEHDLHRELTIPSSQTLAESFKLAHSLKIPESANANKYCAFHGTHGHDTDYRSWKMHLEELIGEGYYTEFVAK